MDCRFCGFTASLAGHPALRKRLTGSLKPGDWKTAALIKRITEWGWAGTHWGGWMGLQATFDLGRGRK